MRTDWKTLRTRTVKHETVSDALRKEKTMRLRMTRDLEIAFDGRTPQALKSGKSYDIPESFVSNLMQKGFAIEDKAIDKVPETKSKKKTTARKGARKY